MIKLTGTSPSNLPITVWIVRISPLSGVFLLRDREPLKELSAETPGTEKDGDCEPGWETCGDLFSATPKIR